LYKYTFEILKCGLKSVIYRRCMIGVHEDIFVLFYLSNIWSSWYTSHTHIKAKMHVRFITGFQNFWSYWDPVYNRLSEFLILLRSETQSKLSDNYAHFNQSYTLSASKVLCTWLVCVCVCVKDGGKGLENGTGPWTHVGYGKKCICVYVCVCVCV